MIIDIHYHLMNDGWDPDKLWFSAKKSFEKAFGVCTEEKIKGFLSHFWDPTG